MSLPNGVSFRSVDLGGYVSVLDDIRTHSQTDHTTVTSVVISGIALNDAV